jgi:hypothetical protein
VVSGPIYAMRQVDIPTVLSRVFFEYTFAVVVVTVGEVIIVIICLIVVVIERPR